MNREWWAAVGIAAALIAVVVVAFPTQIEEFLVIVGVLVALMIGGMLYANRGGGGGL